MTDVTAIIPVGQDHRGGGPARPVAAPPDAGRTGRRHRRQHALGTGCSASGRQIHADHRLSGRHPDLGSRRQFDSDHPGHHQTVFDSMLRYSPELKPAAAPIHAMEVARQQRHPAGDHPARRHPVPRRRRQDDDGRQVRASACPSSAKADKKLLVGGDAQHTEPTSRMQSLDLGSDGLQPADPGRSDLPGFPSQAYVVPRASAWPRSDPEGFNALPIGAGPTGMVEHQRGSRIVLEAFDKYWGEVPRSSRSASTSCPKASARVALMPRGHAAYGIAQLPLREVQRLASEAFSIRDQGLSRLSRAST